MLSRRRRQRWRPPFHQWQWHRLPPKSSPTNPARKSEYFVRFDVLFQFPKPNSVHLNQARAISQNRLPEIRFTSRTSHSETLQTNSFVKSTLSSSLRKSVTIMSVTNVQQTKSKSFASCQPQTKFKSDGLVATVPTVTTTTSQSTISKHKKTKKMPELPLIKIGNSNDDSSTSVTAAAATATHKHPTTTNSGVTIKTIVKKVKTRFRNKKRWINVFFGRIDSHHRYRHRAT